MNIKQVAAYVMDVGENDIKWAKRDKALPRVIYGRSYTLGRFCITGRLDKEKDKLDVK